MSVHKVIGPLDHISVLDARSANCELINQAISVSTFF